MNKKESEWWRQREIPWSDEEPRKLLKALSEAYPSNDKLINVAEFGGIRRTKFDQQGAPEAVAKRILETAASSNLIGNLVQVCLEDDSVAAYHPEIRQLACGSLRLEVAAAKLYRVSEADFAGATADVEFLSPLAEHLESFDSDETRAGLQAILDHRRGFSDPVAFLVGMVNLFRRTAMIEIDGYPEGTGFLIGPKHLLTCYHVVQSVLDNGDTGHSIDAVFDFFAGGLTSESERRNRISGTVVDGACSPPAPEEVHSEWRIERNVTSEYLDYAVIELSEPAGEQAAGPLHWITPAGNERGHFQLPEAHFDVSKASRLFIAQHPQGAPLVFSDATSPFKINATGTRVRYKANTLPGSSGSPVIDERGRIVAMHHLGAKEGVNQGVPISTIGRQLLNVIPELFNVPTSNVSKAATASIHGSEGECETDQIIGEKDETIYLAGTVKAIHEILDRNERVRSAIASVEPALLRREGAGWQLKPEIQQSNFDLLETVEQINNCLRRFQNGPEFSRDDLQQLDEVIGGIAVLGVNRQWLRANRERLCLKPITLHADGDELCDYEFGERARADLLSLATKVLVETTMRLDKFFGDPDREDGHKQDGDRKKALGPIPDEDRYKTTVALENAYHLKVLFIEWVLKPHEYEKTRFDPSKPAYVDDRFQKVLDHMNVARRKRKSPFTGLGETYRESVETLRHLKMNDLYIICPTVEVPSDALLNQPVHVVTELYEIHQWIRNRQEQFD